MNITDSQKKYALMLLVVAGALLLIAKRIKAAANYPQIKKWLYSFKPKTEAEKMPMKCTRCKGESPMWKWDNFICPLCGENDLPF